jgi:hypothetical protein
MAQTINAEIRNLLLRRWLWIAPERCRSKTFDIKIVVLYEFIHFNETEQFKYIAN